MRTIGQFKLAAPCAAFALALLAPLAQAAPVLSAGYTDAAVATLPGPSWQPIGDIASDAAGNRYVTGGFSQSAYKVDAEGHVSAFVNPSNGGTVYGLEVVGNNLYVGSETSGLTRVDLTTGAATNLAAATGTPLALAYGAGKLFVGTNLGLYAYDVATNSFAATAVGGGIYNSLAFANDGHLLVADYVHSRILSYDPAGNTYSVFRTGIKDVAGIAVHAPTGKVYAASEGEDKLFEIAADGSSASVFGSNFKFNPGFGPTGLSFSQDGGQLYFQQLGPYDGQFQLHAISGFSTAAPVPEPGTLAMSALGLGALFVSKRRSRKGA